MSTRFSSALLAVLLLCPQVQAAETPPAPAPSTPSPAPDQAPTRGPLSPAEKVQAPVTATESAAAGKPEGAPTADEMAPAQPAPPVAEPALDGEVDAAARELEELRAAEEQSVDESGKRAADLYRSIYRLGPASPLRLRLDDVLSPGHTLSLIPDLAELEAAALAEVGEFDIEKARKLYDIPVEMNPAVAEYIRFFQLGARKHYVKWMGRSFRYLPMMRQKLKEEGLPLDTIYLAMIESGFSNLALSRAKAMGIWQFIQPTGVRYGLRVDFWVDERRDPVKATGAAAAYLKDLYEEFGDWRLAWSGYNAGENTVRKAMKLEKTRDFWEIAKTRRFRQETKHYVPKLMAAALIAKHPRQFGFDEAEWQAQAEMTFDEVTVPEATALDTLAEAAGVTVDAIVDLNPELRRYCTPPPRKAGEAYKLRLPAGSGEAFAQNFARQEGKERLTFKAHTVGRGDTLSKIAKHHGSAPEAIMRMNGLRDSRRLKLGTELLVPVPHGTGVARALAEQSRKQGFYAAPADQEVPASAPPPRGKANLASGVVKTTKEGSRTKVVYAVSPGDSLWTIARAFSVTVDQLKDWNHLDGQRRIILRLGQELVLYREGEGKDRKGRPGDPRPATKASPRRGR